MKIPMNNLSERSICHSSYRPMSCAVVQGKTFAILEKASAALTSTCPTWVRISLCQGGRLAVSGSIEWLLLLSVCGVLAGTCKIAIQCHVQTIPTPDMSFICH